MDAEIERGSLVRYRNGNQIAEQKSCKIRAYNNTWFLKGGVTSVLRTAITPNSELANKIRNKIGKRKAPDGGLTKVVERVGDRVNKGLYRADPF